MSTCPGPDRLLRLLGDRPARDRANGGGRPPRLLPGLPRGSRPAGGAGAASGTTCRCFATSRPASSTGDRSKSPEAVPPDDEDIPMGLLEPPDQPGHLGKLGPYDVLRLIGRGGMGIVFLARDRALNRLVAIKVLAPRWPRRPPHGGGSPARPRPPPPSSTSTSSRSTPSTTAAGPALPGHAVHRRPVAPGADRPRRPARARRRSCASACRPPRAWPRPTPRG